MLHKPWKVVNGVSIYGNNHVRPILYTWDLTSKELSEFDYLEDPEDASFFRYKSQVYDLGDVMRVDWHVVPEWMREFDGYVNDSFFSGILVKFAETDSYEWGLKVYTFIA